MATAAKQFKVMGTTNDVTSCELCGRSDLHHTIVLVPLDADGNDAGAPVYYGSECGARAAGWKQSEVVKAAKTADEAAVRAVQAARLAASQVEDALRQTFFVAVTGKTDRAEQIKALGGFTAAFAAYEASK